MYYRMILILVLTLAGRMAGADESARSVAQEAKREKAEQKAQEGALRPRADPAADLALQRENLAKLEFAAAQDRAVGNRAGAWAAELDARRVRRLIEKDKKLIGEA